MVEKELTEVREFLTRPDEVHAKAWNSVTDEQAKSESEFEPDMKTPDTPWRQTVWSSDYTKRHEEREHNQGNGKMQIEGKKGCNRR